MYFGFACSIGLILLLESVEIAQLKERKDFDLKMVDSIPMCSSNFLPPGHHCSLADVRLYSWCPKVKMTEALKIKYMWITLV